MAIVLVKEGETLFCFAKQKRFKRAFAQRRADSREAVP
jgi:hypothetical protein